MAVRWMIVLVDPPSAISTVSAFSNASLVRIRSGVIGSHASSAARRPVATALRSRSALPEVGEAPPGSISPTVSATQAMVEAEPITMQVPGVEHSCCCTWRSSSSPILPSRKPA